MNNKKIAAIVLFGLTMTTCASPANGQQNKSTDYVSAYQEAGTLSFLKDAKIKQTKLEQEATAAKELIKNTELMNKAIKSLKSYVGKTWYVFSGSTPSGWDCSGLTLWFYEQQDIVLEHRATKQANAGKATESPKPGDIVVFKYNGSKSAYHVGIYIDEDTMIHAPKHGHVTRVESISSFAGNYSDVSYRTIVETK